MSFATRFAVGCVALLVSMASLSAAEGPSPPGHLNVVLIMADDLGYGDLSCQGNTRIKTPHIDQLAREGVRLTSFYVPVPYCAPTRASLMTGRYPTHCGLTANPFPKEDLGGVKGGDQLGLPLEEVTLGDVFHKAGYRTGCFGKWHLGHQPRFRPLRRGFDEYFGLQYSNDMHPVELYDGNRVAEYPVQQRTLTKRLTERAVSFIEKNKDRPFLLYFPQVAPHKPLAASKAFYHKSRAGLYGDTVQEMDWSVGQVMAKLKALGLEKKTLVLFTSDNGPWYGGSTGGLRGMKGQHWEGGIRMPMIARLPGVIPAGRTSKAPAIIMDLFVTACKAAGVPLPKGRVLDGKDLMPLLKSPDGKGPHDYLFSTRGKQVVSVRDVRWKFYLRPPSGKQKLWKPDEPWKDPRAPDGKRILAPLEQAHPSQFPGVLTGPEPKAGLLFDLEADPGEQHDLAAKHPEVVRKLSQVARAFESK
jgi:N-acetylgalactosamine-6-sulfatase